MTTAELCAAFEVGESTVHAKARVIEKAVETQPFDPQWTLPSLIAKNPLVWMAQVNGLLVDWRDMPREVQEIAFEDGLIPYVPADRKGRSEIRCRCVHSSAAKLITCATPFLKWCNRFKPARSEATR